jgi:hypothetical protein
VTAIAGMTPTGRKIAAPAVDLIEVTGPNGLKHQALVHHERWRGHNLITHELKGKLAFMEKPEVTGLVRLAAHDLAMGAFAYPTGTVWTVSEIVRTYVDNGAAPGVKAGLELCYLVGEYLTEAADAAAPQGIVGHGNVNPWTIVLKGDGQPLLAGYGLPQVELLAWRDDPHRLQLVEDSFRYAPPERIETGEEDLSSDLFSLVLVALELMVGRPVYDGVLADVKQQATRGEGMRRLYQWREKLPQNVREVMGRALKPDPDTRFPGGLDLVYAVHDLLGSIDVEGPSLADVMAKMRASEKRGRALKGGQTQLLSPEEMAELAADLQEVDQAPLPPPRRPRPEEGQAEDGDKPRWSKPVRRGEPAPAPAVQAAPVTSGGASSVRRPPVAAEAAGPQDRQRRRVSDGSAQGPVEASAPVPVTPFRPEPNTERERLRRRLRGSNLTPEELAEPDDVQLEPVTGGLPAPEPLPTPRGGTGRTSPVARPVARPADPQAPQTEAPDEPLPSAKKLDVVATTLPASKAPAPTLMSVIPPEGQAGPAPLPGRVVAASPKTQPSSPAQSNPAQPSAVQPTPAQPTPRQVPDEDPLDSQTPAPAPSQHPSAAAALLEKLRTSGDRRRRLRNTADEGVPAQPVPASPASQVTAGRFPTAERPAVSNTAGTGSVTAPNVAAQQNPGQQVPAPPTPTQTAGQAVAPPPPPVTLGLRTLNPVVSERTDTEQRPVTRTVEVRFAGHTHAVTWRPDERAGSLAVRAATEAGAWVVDPTGRLLGGFRLQREGGAVPAGAPIPLPEPGAAPYDLVPLLPESKLVEVVVVTEPQIRLRTPMEMATPCTWVVNGLVAWLGLPPGEWAIYTGQIRIDDDRPLGEAVTNGTLEIRRAG